MWVPIMSDRSTCALCRCNRPGTGWPLSFDWLWDGQTLPTCETCSDALVAADARADYPVPRVCLHRLAQEVEQQAEDWPDLAKRKRRLKLFAPLFERGVFRAACGCETCRMLRDADGWRQLVALVSDVIADLGGGSLRDPIEAIDLPSVVLKTCNPGQAIRLQGGAIVPADEAMRRRMMGDHMDTLRPAGPRTAGMHAAVMRRGQDNTPPGIREKDDGFRRAYWADHALLGVDAARLNDVRRRFHSAMWDEFFTPARGYYDWNGAKLWWVEDETGEAFDISDLLPERRS